MLFFVNNLVEMIKIFQIVSLSALCSLLLSGCAATKNEDGLTYAEAYQAYNNTKATDPQLAQNHLLKAIQSKDITNDTYHLFVEQHAWNIANGVYGDYDQPGFKYWVNTIGSGAGTALQYHLRGVEAITSAYHKNPQEISTYHQEITTFCDKSFNVPTQPITGGNVGLIVMKSKDCISKNLIKSSAARTLYIKFLQNFDKRDNSAAKAIGMSLYETPPTKYNKLDIAQKKSLLDAKIQILNFSIAGAAPNPKHSGTRVGWDNFKQVMKFVDSKNDKDWETISQLNNDFNRLDVSPSDKDFFNYFVLKAAYLNNRIKQGEEAALRLLKSDNFSVEEKYYIQILRLSIYSENKRYLDGLALVDHLINEQSDKSAQRTL